MFQHDYKAGMLTRIEGEQRQGQDACSIMSAPSTSRMSNEEESVYCLTTAACNPTADCISMVGIFSKGHYL